MIPTSIFAETLASLLSPIQRFLEDATVSEILINQHGHGEAIDRIYVDLENDALTFNPHAQEIVVPQR